MDISKFLLIDAAFVITATPLLVLLQGRKIKSNLLKKINKQELLRKKSVTLPDKKKLIAMEKVVMSQGSGIEIDSLHGDWKFLSIWKKNNDKVDPVFSSLLRVFSAKIKFKKDDSSKNFPKIGVVVSIQFGLLTIEFLGSGYLKEKQPLLPFFFNLIELKSGSTVLLSRSLKEPEDKEKIFFALISLEEDGKLLSARGQGGAMIILLKD